MWPWFQVKEQETVQASSVWWVLFRWWHWRRGWSGKETVFGVGHVRVVDKISKRVCPFESGIDVWSLGEMSWQRI